MPVMTGYAFLKEVRQRVKDNHTAVIVQTSLNTRDDVMECAKLGIQGYIVKPPDLDTITEKILSCYAKLHPEKAKAVWE
jgi:two-component system, chemotaxis family, chemotaxis protein CheY